jgi:hypothetical protein
LHGVVSVVAINASAVRCSTGGLRSGTKASHPDDDRRFLTPAVEV